MKGKEKRGRNYFLTVIFQYLIYKLDLYPYIKGLRPLLLCIGSPDTIAKKALQLF